MSTHAVLMRSVATFAVVVVAVAPTLSGGGGGGEASIDAWRAWYTHTHIHTPAHHVAEFTNISAPATVA